MENKMSDKYFDLLIEMERTTSIIGKIIKNYLADNYLPCNVAQIIMIHVLLKIGDNASPTEVHLIMQDISTNDHYNFTRLVKNGLLVQKTGRDIGTDNRCVFFSVTDKGKELYDKICKHLDETLQKLYKAHDWGEENLQDNLDRLDALQDFLAGR
jgi:DNA-binding MarR family transcriptional regulator